MNKSKIDQQDLAKWQVINTCNKSSLCDTANNEHQVRYTYAEDAPVWEANYV